MTNTASVLELPSVSSTLLDRIERSLLDRIEAGLESDECTLLVALYGFGKSELAAAIAHHFGGGAHILDTSLADDRVAMFGMNGPLRSNPRQARVIDENHDRPKGLSLLRTALVPYSDLDSLSRSSAYCCGA